jgi:uncharacterized protein YjiK
MFYWEFNYKISHQHILIIVLIIVFSAVKAGAQPEEILPCLNQYSFERSLKTKIPIREASGLAFDPRNNLFYVHEDSFNPNEVYILDNTGKLVKTITLTGIINNDWEDITTEGKGTFWIINSQHNLIEFKTDLEANLVKDSIKSYPLPDPLKSFNIESLEYIPAENTFVIVAKSSKNEIYKFAIGDKNAEFIGTIPKKYRIQSSGLVLNPSNGNFFLLSFWGHKILELTPDFKEVVCVLPMPASLSFQPEGIAFDKDSNLVIVAEKPWYSLRGKSTLLKLSPVYPDINYEADNGN